MRVLLLEDKVKKNSIKRTVKNKVANLGGQTQYTATVWEALEYLAKEDIDLVVVHHYDFSDVDELRAKFPKVKYAGYNQDLWIVREFAGNPKSFSAAFLKKFSAHYDYVFYGFGRDLNSILISYAKKK